MCVCEGVYPRSSILRGGPEPSGFLRIRSCSLVFFSSSDKLLLDRICLLFIASSFSSFRKLALQEQEKVQLMTTQRITPDLLPAVLTHLWGLTSWKSSQVRIPWYQAGGFGFGGSMMNSDLESSSKLPTE